MERPGRAPVAAPPPILADYYAATSAQYRQGDAYVGPGAIVWLGDSITDFISLPDLVESDRPIVNRGIAGDTTSGILARLERSFPADVAVCVLMIGHNDLARGAAPAGTAARTVQAVRTLTDRYKVRQVLVEALLPSIRVPADAADAYNRALESGLHSLAACRWVRLDDPARGAMWGPDCFSDGVHLSAAGARLRLRQELEEIRSAFPEFSLRMRDGSPE